MTVLERFMEKVMPEPTTGCWLWTASLNQYGYGQFFPTSRVCRGAHRVAYELLVGPIPDGLQLDHLCRVRCCVNPAHLEPVTARENVLRGEGRAAVNARKSRCHRGHPLDGRQARGRKCKTCHRETQRRYLARKGMV